MRRLTDEHIACLRLLDRLGDNGSLTANTVLRAGPSCAPTSWATCRMKTLAARGLVQRHKANDQRWYITPAGRAALTDPPDAGPSHREGDA